MKQYLPSKLPWTAYVDGDDLVVNNVKGTCFGGRYDSGDSGQTESGVMNNGSNKLLQCALPIRSIEKATKNSPLAFKGPHIEWKTKVLVWTNDQKECDAVETILTDNGPDISKYPDHALDLNPEAALRFIGPYKEKDREKILRNIANTFSRKDFNYRIIGGAKYIDKNITLEKR